MKTIMDMRAELIPKTPHQVPDLSMEESRSIGKYTNSNQLPLALCAEDNYFFAGSFTANWTNLSRPGGSRSISAQETAAGL